MVNYQELPRIDDKWSYLYLDHCSIERDTSGLKAYSAEKCIQIPINKISLLMVGPGTSISHKAVEMLAKYSCMIAWVGEHGVRCYAHSTGATHSSRRLINQANLISDPDKKLRVARLMYEKRFPDPIESNITIEQLRGKEGQRVRSIYREQAEANGIEWKGRNYDVKHWHKGDPVNRALSTANAALYGICHAAIVTAGYSPGLGFIHSGNVLSFVYDIADLYKTEITIPLAFRIGKENPQDLERITRIACRDIFFENKLMKRILPDIQEVLGDSDDLRELPGELEGRIVTLADRTSHGGVYRESEFKSEGRVMEEG